VDPTAGWTIWRGENSLPHRDSNSDPSVVQAVASHYTNCAIPAPMIWAVLMEVNTKYHCRNIHLCQKLKSKVSSACSSQSGISSYAFQSLQLRLQHRLKVLLLRNILFFLNMYATVNSIFPVPIRSSESLLTY
jgi:hypothetical protein